MAVSLNLALGYAGILHMAQSAFMGIGAYVTALLLTKAGFNFFAALPVAIVISGGIGVLLAWGTFRLKGDYYVIASFGFQSILYSILLNWIGLTNGPFGIREIPAPTILGFAFSSPLRYAVFCMAFLAACVWIAWRVGESPFGKILRAIREDEAAAASIGKDVKKFKILIFMLSTMLGSVGGALYAGLIGYIDPFPFTIHESIFIIALVVIGGSGNIVGSLVGAAVLFSIPEMLRFFDVPTSVASPIREILYGSLMVIFMRLRPKGLIPEKLNTGGR
jgi:branched-chain amino acid transport system permease protein